jgi:adenylosuccinate synthase
MDELRGGLVLLSGAVTAGKSSLAAALIANHGFRKISTSGYLTELAAAQGLENRRDVLQALGDRLDEETDYSWPISVAQRQIQCGQHGGPWLLDAVRKDRQVFHFRAAFSRVLHVHVTAPEEVLRARYLFRQGTKDSRDSQGTYDELIKHPNEVSSRALEFSADLVFDSNSKSAAAMADAVVQALRGGADGAGGSDQRASGSG